MAGRWHRHDSGWTRTGAGPGVPMISSIRRHAGMWRLARGEAWRGPDEMTDRFESRDPRACMAYDRFLDRYDAASDAWDNRSFHVEREGPRAGISTWVTKRSGSDHATGHLLDGDNVVGTYSVTMSHPETCYIAGEMTVNGSCSVDARYRGQGLGRALYDAVASACGMRCVPHGRDFAPGNLSDMAAAFWEKRARHGDLPTATPEARARHAEIAAPCEVILCERRNAGSTAFLLALADVTGGALVGNMTRDGAGSPEDIRVRLLDGREFDVRGPWHPPAGDGRSAARDVSTLEGCRIERAAMGSRGAFFPYFDGELSGTLEKALPDVATFIRRHLPEMAFLADAPRLSERLLSCADEAELAFREPEAEAREPAPAP